MLTPPPEGRPRRWMLVVGASTLAVIVLTLVAVLESQRPAPEVTVAAVTPTASVASTSGPVQATPEAVTPGAATPSASVPTTSSPTSASTSVNTAAPAPPTSTIVATAVPTATVLVEPKSALPTPSSTALPTSTAAPGAATPGALTPFVMAPAAVGVGESFQVRAFAAGAATATVELDTARYSLIPAPDRFWGIVGIPVDAATGPRTLRVSAFSGTGVLLGTATVPILFAAVQRPVDYLEVTDEVGAVLTEDAAATELAIRAGQFASFDPAKRWNGPFVLPVVGPQTTAFGQGRSINGGPIGGFHSGMDIGADAGTPVHASADGRVVSVARMPIRGLSVVIDHGAGVKSGYHHLDSALVREGDMVQQGQPIATVGSSGFSTGPHLHWEVLVWGVNVDPLQWTSERFEP